MTKQEIKHLLKNLKFNPDITDNVWTKTYPVSKYTVTVDTGNEKINYGEKIELGDKTTSNFSHDENFVVLECVNRLLEKGYFPEHLTLERKWQVGHGASGGKADINVFDREGKTLIIIECKTWGKEYEKYKQKMIHDGAQLFSYLQQDKNTKFLCLYTSHIQGDKIVYTNAVVHIRDREETLRLLDEGQEVKTYKEAKTKEELHDVWKENFNCYFAPNGIFDDEVQAYNPEHIPIKMKDLKGFGEEEGRKFFYQFLEILRHNNISDKSNAFNRIMSLILCKIVDERKADNEITDFQIIEGKDTPESIQERLQNLYARGMKEFLREEIVNYTEKDIDDIVSCFPRQKAQKQIKKILRALKFYSNNEFAFKEVHNEKLFLENAKVLNEIITLLQYKKFRYSYADNGDEKFQKQYLGNFFELLLDSGYKQDEGQFFTPIPIAKFIVWCLPIKEIIEKKLKEKKADFFPYVMDYACGSGHFLTEIIEEIQNIIAEFEPVYDDSQNKDIEFFKTSTMWCERFIFGIEKDYRLARTSKVACFMHGDGEATIIFGDGLEDHQVLTKGYDIIIANPPYSVHGFKPHIQKLGDNYSLYQYLTDNSSEIEALFVERTAQLLNKDGIAGIILPSSLLNSNTTIYTKAREFLLQNFEIRAIVECGSETFLATETNTIILFLKKRDSRWKEDFHYVAEDFILYNKERKDDFADTEGMFKAYAENLELDFDEYKTLAARKPGDRLKQTEWFQDYQNWFDGLTEVVNIKKSNIFKQLNEDEKKEKLEKLFYERVLAVETEKLYYFLLAYGQQTLVVKTGAGKEEQRSFFGYEKKKGKRDAGLKMYLENGKHVTMLYDEYDKFNEEKVNSYINRHLSGDKLKIEGGPEKHVECKHLPECLNFRTVNFDLQILISGQSTINFKAFWQMSDEKLVRLKDICEFSKGTSITKAQVKEGKYPVIAGGMQPAYYHDKFNFNGDVITVSASGANAGYIQYHTDKIFASDCSVIKSKNHAAHSTKIIFLFLKMLQKQIYRLQKGSAQPHIYISDLEGLKIPSADPEKQKQISAYFEKIEKEEAEFKNEIEINSKKLRGLVSDIKGEKGKIKNYFVLNEETLDPAKKYGGNYFTYIDIESIGKDNGKISFNKKIKGSSAPSRARRVAKDGSAIISTVRPNLKGFAFIDKVPDDCIFSTGFAIIKSKNENEYKTQLLYYLFRHDAVLMEQILAKMPKSSYPSITQEDIYNFEIPVIPIDEQEKMVRQISDIENTISMSEDKLSKISEQKENILKKYLLHDHDEFYIFPS